MQERWWPLRVYAGEVAYTPGGTYGPRLQQEYELLLLHSGSLDLTLDDVHQFHYDAGTVLLLTPGHTEFCQFAPDSYTQHSFISIAGPELPAHWWQPHDCRPPAIEISTHMQNLVKEAVYWHGCGNAEHLLLAIGYHALQLFFQELRTAAGKNVTKNDVVCLVEWYIRRRYREEISLEDLCRYAGVSKEHLCRLFRQQHGIGPMSYLWRYRTRRASHLLVTTGLSVADIAAACGFKTASHLHRRIKAFTSMAPSQFRKKNLASSS